MANDTCEMIRAMVGTMMVMATIVAIMLSLAINEMLVAEEAFGTVLVYIAFGVSIVFCIPAVPVIFCMVARPSKSIDGLLLCDGCKNVRVACVSEKCLHCIRYPNTHLMSGSLFVRDVDNYEPLLV